MVAEISGSGLGLFNSSGATLGKNGVSGNSNLGQGQEQVYINTTTGNLVIQHQDDFLSSIGQDLSVIRTYNSQGQLDGDNNDNWKIGLYRRVYNLTGTAGVAGSAITKVFGDGAEVIYSYSSTNGQNTTYVSSDGDGANDTLTYNSGTMQWTWTDGSNRATETYDTLTNGGRIVNAKDAEGNQTTYNYTGILLTSIVDASGQTTYLDYAGTNLTKIRVVSNGQTQTLTSYGYDASSRLQTVTVDLTPGNATDSSTYTSTYTYDGASNRVASITQKDNTTVSFTYQQIDGAWRVKTYIDGNGNVTTLNYTSASTTTSSGTPTTVNANAAALLTTNTTNQSYNVNSASLSTTTTANQTYNLNNSALSTTSTTTQTYNINNAALSTTSTTSQTYNVNNAALSTTNTTTQAYSLNTGALSGGGVATPTYKQGNSNGVTFGASVSTTYANAQTAGNLNVVVVSWVGSTSHAVTITDTKGNVYTRAAFNVSAGSGTTSVYYAKNIAAATAGTNVVTVTLDGGDDNLEVTVTEYSGIDKINPLDVAVGAVGTGVAASSGSVTTTNANDLLFGNAYVASSVASAGSGYTYRLDTIFADGLEDRAVTSAGSYSASVNQSSSSWWVMQMVAFKAATTGTQSYTVPASSTWQTIANTLYGINSAAAGTALQTAMGNPSIASGAVLTGMPATLNVSTTTTVPAYYLVPASATWQTIANAVYGINSAAAGAALQTAMGGGAVPAANTQLTGLPATLTVSTTTTVPAYYLVPASATWQTIANAVYGINSAAAGTALQTAMGGGAVPAANTQLTGLPATLTVSGTTQTYSLNNGALSTTSTTSQTYNVNNAALSTTNTTTQAYSLNTGALSGGTATTPTYVQGNTNGVGSGTTVSTTYTSAQTAGNLNVIVLSWIDPSPRVLSVTDSKGNVYTRAILTASALGSGAGTTTVYYAKNIVAAAANTNTVTVTLDSSVPNPELSVLEYSGVDKINPLDIAVGATGSSATANSGSVTTTNANDLLIGNAYVTNSVATAGSGYTNRLQTIFADGIEDRTVTSAGSYNASMSQSGSGWWVMQMVAFKAATTGTQSYTVPASSTWQTIANTLYGINSAAAGTALQTAMGNPSIASGAVLTGIPATLNVSTTTTVPAYYLVPASATWQTIANAVYGINSAAAGAALQTAMGGGAVPAANTQLTGLPATLTVSTTTTVPAYYLVPASATWQTIANAVYGINSAAAGTALQTAMGGGAVPAANTQLTGLPATLTVSGTVTVPAYYLVPSGATWQSIANALYGINSTAAGGALQTAMGGGAVPAANTQLTGLPTTLTVSTTTTVPAYYLVPSAATWQTIANAVYGINSAAAGAALQTAMGGIAVPAVNTQLTGLPATLTVSTTTTVPAYYLVSNTTTQWSDVALAVYGTSDANAVIALQNAVISAQGSLPALSLNYHLTVPASLSYTPASGGASQTTYLQTTVTDALGLITTYKQDSVGRLIEVDSPPVSGTPLIVKYGYDTQGNVTSITQDPNGLNRVTNFIYDANNNLLISRDNAGNTVTRTYDTNNQLVTATSYLAPDPDAINTGASPSNPLTTRYVYDSKSNVRFTISAEGRVAEYQYNTAGLRTASLTYASGVYDVNALSATTTLSESQLMTWTASQDKTKLERVDYAYDFRGNVGTATAYATTDSAGAGVATNASIVRYVYDQRGQLLQKLDPRGSASTPDGITTNIPYSTTYVYDGLSRLASSTEWVLNNNYDTSRSYTTLYDDANSKAVTTYRNGLVTTTVYDHTGVITSVNNSGTNVNATTTYTYDTDGRLRTVTDPTGLKQYTLYDEASRQVASIDANGSLTEYVYNGTSQLVKTIRYADALTSTTLATLLDAQGKPTSVTLATLKAALPTTVGRASDQIIRVIYDAAGRLVYTIDAVGDVTQSFYDGAGRLTDQISYANAVSIASSEGELRAVATQLVVGNAIATRTFNNVSGTQVGTLNLDSANDRRTHNFYDNDGHVAGTVDGAGYLTEYKYDAAGQLTQQIAYANKTSATFWVTGTLASLRPATDTETAISYWQDSNTYFFYDGEGREVGTLDSEGYLTETRYDMDGHVVKTLRYDPYSNAATRVALSYIAGTTTLQTLLTAVNAAPILTTHTTDYVYDGAGRLSQETNYQGTITTYSYDAVDHVISSTQASGTTDARATQTKYDVLGRVIAELSGEGSAAIAGGTTVATAWDRYGITYTYDQAGRRVSAASKPYDSVSGTQQTNTSYYYYNEDGQLRFAVNALGEVTETKYNALGQVTDAIQYANRISTAGLAGGLLTTALATVLTAGSDSTRDAKTSYTYKLTGQVATQITATGGTTSYGYNAFGNLTTQTIKLDSARNIVTNDVYDTRGLLKSATLDSTGANHFLTYSYDAFGRRYQSVDQYGNTTKVDYDRLGRTIATYDALNNKSSLTYDAFSRTLTTLDANQNKTTYQYDDVNRKVTVTAPTNTIVTTVANRLGQTITATDASGVIATMAYDHDGNATDVTTASGTGNASTTHYVYDSIDRTITVTEGYGNTATGFSPRVTQYTYDGAGRRTDEIVKNVLVDASATGIATLTDLHTYYKYDAKGNLSRKIDPKGNSTWYVYDKDNRLTQIIDALGGVTENTYDVDSNVVAVRRYATATAVPSPGTDVATAATIAIDANNDRYEQYVYDTAGRQVYHVQNVVINGAAKAIVTQMAYDANGNVIKKTGFATAINQGTFVSPSSVAVAITDNDRVIWITYDQRNQAIFTIQASGANASNVQVGNVTRNTYDANGNLIQTTDFASQFAIPAATDLASMQVWVTNNTNANDRTTRYWYDGVNRVRYTLDAEGYLTETQFADATRQQTRIVYAKLQTTNTTLTATAKTTDIVPLTDSTNDQKTRTVYDEAGRVYQVYDALNNYEQYTYDSVGNKISYRNQKGDVWNYEYDANHQLTKERSPSVSVTTLAESGSSLTPTTTSTVIETTITYDAFGNVKTRIEASNTSQARTTIYSYDQLGRQIQVTYPAVGVYDATSDTVSNQTSSSTVYYDILGNAYKSVDVAGNTSYKTYDQLGRVINDIDALGYVTQYAYDAFGNQTTLTRYATATTSAPTTGYAAVSVTTSAINDRIIATTYDRLNRKVQVAQPSVYSFEPNINSSGGTYLDAISPTTKYEYNAFGQLVRQRQLVNPNGNSYADTYYYYDHKGQKTAQVDPLGYLTTYQYDQSGNVKDKIEYARATTGWNAASFGTPTVTTRSTSLDNANGYDRETKYTYDVLNRKSSQTVVGVETAAINGATVTLGSADQVTNYGYDAVGNQTTTTLRNVIVNGIAQDSSQYTYYDVLGRVIAVAQPTRNPGDGTSLTPFSMISRDAFGNLVQQIDYASGTNAAPIASTLPTAAVAPAGASDHTTRTLFDSAGHATHTFTINTPNNINQYFAYNKRGDIAKQWQYVTGVAAGATQSPSTFIQTLATFNKYDALGRVISVRSWKDLTFNGYTSVEKVMSYNAFGEVITKGVVDGSAASGTQEFFNYDQAGRVWRTNTGDGVTKVYLYNLAGDVTAELRSQNIDLSSASYKSSLDVITNVSASSLMRTETRYDLDGHAVEQRLPTFSISDPIAPATSSIQIGSIAGPSNPLAAYKQISYYAPYGNSATIYVLGQPLNAGYYINASGNYQQDLTSVVNQDIRIYWNTTYDPSVKYTFEYRVAGSNSAYSQLTVGAISPTQLGVDVQNLTGQLYEYRLSYQKGIDSTPYAQSSGTFRVDANTGTTLPAISLNSADPAATISTLAVSQTSGAVTWTAPADTTVNAVVRYKSAGALSWAGTLTATRAGANFIVNGQIAFATAGNYDYEIEYTRSSVVVARNDGQLASGGVVRSVSGSDTENALTTFSQTVSTVSASGMSLSWAPPTGIAATGTINQYGYYYSVYGGGAWIPNVVSLSWPDVGPGKVRVVLSYQSANGLTSLTKDFTSANTGVQGWSWDSSTDGGILSISSINVYSVDANNNIGILLRSSSVAGSAQAPDAFNATFEYSLGNGSFQTLTINQPVGGNWNVDVSGLVKGNTYGYRITYKIGGRVVSQQTGTFSITNSSSTSTTTLPTVVYGTPPAATASVSTLSANGSVLPASGTITMTALLVFHGGPYGGGAYNWDYANVVQTSWADIGAAKVRIVINYLRLDGSAASYTGDYTGANTGKSVSWGGDVVDINNQNHGGISQITNISVYALDANNNQGALLRSKNSAGGSLSINWTESTGSYAPRFWYNNGSNWIEKTATRNGSSLSVDLTGIASGTYSYYVGQFLPSATYDFANATGTFTTNGSSAASINSQTNATRDPTWISGIAVSGSRITWTQVLQSGASASFQYYNGSSWVSLPVTNSSGNNYYVDFLGVAAGTYNYQINYTQSVSGDPATTTMLYARATGTATVAVNTTTTPSTLSVSAPSSNTSNATQRITPITLSTDTLSWSYTKGSGGDSITVLYWVNGVAYTATVNGSGPSYSAAMSQVPVGSNQLIPWTISYTRSGESSPYAYASGTATLTVSNVQPTLTINSQVPVYPSNVQQITAPTDQQNGLLGLSGITSGDTIVFTCDGTALYSGVVNATTYQVNVSQYASGTSHIYSVTYTHNGQPNPYAQGTGSFTINKNTTYATNATLDSAASSVVNAAPTLKQNVDRWGNVLSSTDTAGNTINYRYNVLGEMVDELLPSTTVVDTRGTISSTTARPEVIKYYDAFGQLLGTKDPNGNLNTVAYNAAGQEVSEKHADTGVKSFVYDAFDNQIQVTDELGFRSRSAYDNVGNLIKQVQEVTANAFGTSSVNSTSFALGVLSNGVYVDNPNVVTRMYGYDEAGRRITATDGSLTNDNTGTTQETTLYTYDSIGNVTQVATAMRNVTLYTYDLEGHKIKQVDAINGMSTSNVDYFGRYAGGNTTTGHTDLAGTTYNYTYDFAGDLLTQQSNAGQKQNITYSYDAAGHVSTVNDTGAGRVSTYLYDTAGRVHREKVTINGSDFQNTVTDYDQLNRIVKLNDIRYTETYSYDLAGNRTHILATYYDHNKMQQTQDLWYTYDSMNRVLVSQGIKTASNTVGINTATATSTNTPQGIAMTYDLAGHRKTAQTYGKEVLDQYVNNLLIHNVMSTNAGTYKETYNYDGLGRLTSTWLGGAAHTTMSNGTIMDSTSDLLMQLNSHTYDGADRETTFTYQAPDSATWVANTTDLFEHTRASQYSDDGQLISQRTGVSTNGVIQATESKVDYYYDAAARLTSYNSFVYQSASDTGTQSTTTNKYVVADRYMDGGQTVKDANGNVIGNTTRTYNVDNELIAFEDANTPASNRYFLNGTTGQSLVVIQGAYTDPVDRASKFNLSLNRDDNTLLAQYYFYSQGNNIGNFGQLTDVNSASPKFMANFDVNYQPTSDTGPTPSQVVAQAGDTLRSIALRVYGDATLWYLIADENGLRDPYAAIPAGTVLRIPNRIGGLSNTFGVYKPFSLFDALGNTSPSLTTLSSSNHPLSSMILYGTDMATYAQSVLAMGDMTSLQYKLSTIPAGTVFPSPNMSDEDKWSWYFHTAFKDDYERSMSYQQAQGHGPGSADDMANIAAGDSFDQDAMYKSSKTFANERAAEAADTKAWEQARRDVRTGANPNAMAEYQATRNLQSFQATNPTADQMTQHLAEHPDENAVVVRLMQPANNNGQNQQQAQNFLKYQNNVDPNNPYGVQNPLDHALDPDGMNAINAGFNDIDTSLSMFGSKLAGLTPEERTSIVAQSGSTISGIMGTSNPMAVEAFMRANGLTSSNIYAGKNYVIPNSTDYAASTGALGQATLNVDNARIAVFQQAQDQSPTVANALRLYGTVGLSEWDNPSTTLPDFSWNGVANATVPLPEIENLYQPVTGYFHNSYNIGVEGMMDSNNSWGQRILFGLGALGTAIPAAVDMAGEAIYNAPNQAWVGGQLWARSNLTNDTDLKVISRLQAVTQFSGAFDGLAGAASMGMPVTAAPLTGEQLALQNFNGAEATAAARASYSARIDYSKGLSRDLENDFMPGYQKLPDVLDQDLTLVSYGPTKTQRYWTTTEQANSMNTINDVRVNLGLLPEWGARTEVSVANVPAGTRINGYIGQARAQENWSTGVYLQGEGTQIRFVDFDPNWIVKTRSMGN